MNGLAAKGGSDQGAMRMAEDVSFCLFRCGSLALAVHVADVAEIVEIDSLVRISFCPPRVVGLCPYHRQVVPVVAFRSSGSGGDSRPSEKRAHGADARSAVLILETEQGLWGITIDRDGTLISDDRPARHQNTEHETGVVTVGLIRHGEVDYALLDAGSTWSVLRDSVARWYGQFSGGRSSSRCFDSPASRLLDPAVTSRSAEPAT
jgi:purine-binding chemotaxis protein CheW